MSSYWENCIGFAICLKNGKFTANLRHTYTSFLRRKNEANERHITAIGLRGLQSIQPEGRLRLMKFLTHKVNSCENP